MTTGNRFEDRLLSKLTPLVGRRRILPTTALRRRPRLAAAGAATVTGAALAIGVPMLAGGTAYAVTPGDDGTVTVEIYDLSDSEGLEEALAEQGVNAVVDYLPLGKTCAEPRFTPAETGGIVSMETSNVDGSIRFSLDVEGLDDGVTLVLTTAGDIDEGEYSVGMAEGDVAACELVDAPRLPDGPGAEEGTNVEEESDEGGTDLNED
ncbi:hypothetical protein [Stackebrandtia soli]|uniref:hypothetical protein n=1 Tax=Stackebrandtia soli TaxID=1892856 RepID=UPI0039EC72C2